MIREPCHGHINKKPDWRLLASLRMIGSFCFTLDNLLFLDVRMRILVGLRVTKDVPGKSVLQFLC